MALNHVSQDLEKSDRERRSMRFNIGLGLFITSLAMILIGSPLPDFLRGNELLFEPVRSVIDTKLWGCAEGFLGVIGLLCMVW